MKPSEMKKLIDRYDNMVSVEVLMEVMFQTIEEPSDVMEVLKELYIRHYNRRV